MNTTGLRQKLHSYLEVADDKKNQDYYAIMEDDIEKSGLVYSDDIKKELDHRLSDYMNGKTKVFNANESRKRVQAIQKN